MTTQPLASFNSFCRVFSVLLLTKRTNKIAHELINNVHRPSSSENCRSNRGRRVGENFVQQVAFRAVGVRILTTSSGKSYFKVSHAPLVPVIITEMEPRLHLHTMTTQPLASFNSFCRVFSVLLLTKRTNKIAHKLINNVHHPSSSENCRSNRGAKTPHSSSKEAMTASTSDEGPDILGSSSPPDTRNVR